VSRRADVLWSGLVHRTLGVHSLSRSTRSTAASFNSLTSDCIPTIVLFSHACAIAPLMPNRLMPSKFLLTIA
jgi:hypothetical protein